MCQSAPWNILVIWFNDVTLRLDWNRHGVSLDEEFLLDHIGQHEDRMIYHDVRIMGHEKSCRFRIMTENWIRNHGFCTLLRCLDAVQLVRQSPHGALCLLRLY